MFFETSFFLLETSFIFRNQLKFLETSFIFRNQLKFFETRLIFLRVGLGLGIGLRLGLIPAVYEPNCYEMKLDSLTCKKLMCVRY